MLRRGEADALALSLDSLRPYLERFVGARILEGSLQNADVAVVVGQGRPHALREVSAFLNEARRSGFVRQAFDRAGLQAEHAA